MPAFKTLWILVLLSLQAKGMYFPFIHNPLSIGTGNIASFKSNPFAACSHSGALAFATQNSISLGFESIYWVEDLNQAFLSLNHRLNKRQILGLGYSFFGNPSYNEGLLKVAMAQKVSKNFGTGLSLNYWRMQLPNHTYAVKHLLTVEAGIFCTINPHVDFAFQVINPFRPSVSNYMDERLPFISNTTFFVNANKKVILSSEWHQIMNEKGTLRFGLTYKISPKLSVRAGAFFRPTNVGFGFTYKVHSFLIHLDFAMHPYLNSHSAASLTYVSSAKGYE